MNLDDQGEKMTAPSTSSTPSKCETFGCPNPFSRLYSIAPAMTVGLCEDCIREAEEAAKMPGSDEVGKGLFLTGEDK